jgi:hypothetical protein
MAVKRPRHEADQSLRQEPRLRAALQSQISLHAVHKDSYILQTLPELRNSYVSEGPAQVWIKNTHGQLHMYIQGSPAETPNPTYKKTVGRSMTNLPPVLSPKSILPPPLPRCTFIPARKTSARLSKCSKLATWNYVTWNWSCGVHVHYMYCRIQNTPMQVAVTEVTKG